jgi:probable rRNA maturation factor
MKKTTEVLKINYLIQDKRWLKLGRDLKAKGRKAIKTTLSEINYYQHLGGCELSILLANNKEIQVLNDNYRGKNKPTNVLSFPAFDLDSAKLTPLLENGGKIPYIGDIAVSYDCVYTESREQNKIFMNHYLHLIIHSVLHLFGFDHIKTKDAKAMEGKEIMILAKLGINNPYQI